MKYLSILFGVVVLTGCFSSEEPMPSEVQIQKAENQWTYRSVNDVYEIIASHPVLESDVLTSILQDAIEDQINWFVTMTDGVTTDDLSDGRKQNLWIDYKQVPYGDGYLSVVFTVSYDTGGAHPNHHMLTMVFDKNAESQLSLDDIFDAPNYMQVIGEIVQQQLLDQEGADAKWIKEGADWTDKENYQSWLLDDPSIVFLFDPYQVAPYAGGVQEAEVSFEDVSELLSDNFAVIKRKKYQLELQQGEIDEVSNSYPDAITLSSEDGTEAIDLPHMGGIAVHIDALEYTDVPVLSLYYAYWAGVANLYRTSYASGKITVEHMVVDEPQPEFETISCSPWTEIGSFSIEPGQRIQVEYGKSPSKYPTDFECDCGPQDGETICRNW